MKNKFLILFALLSLGWMSCDLGNDPDPGGTATQAVAGEWWTTFTIDGEDVYGIGYQVITTSNLASNSTNEFLIHDGAHTWNYKVKTPLNLDAKTFGGGGRVTNLVPDYGIWVDIANGKILPGAATSTGGNVTDSIYFEVTFEDDSLTTYQVAGYRRTGFLEDEH